MDIKALPAGTHCLIDANIFIYHLADASHESSEFIARIGRYEIEGFVTTTIVAEVLHRRMMAEALAKSLITPGQPLKKLKASPHVITRLVDYKVELEKLLELPLTVIETTAADILASDELRRAYGLFVNDPVNLACAHRNGLSDIVSHDDDFRRVPNIRLWGTYRHLTRQALAFHKHQALACLIVGRRFLRYVTLLFGTLMLPLPHPGQAQAPRPDGAGLRTGVLLSP